MRRVPRAPRVAGGGNNRTPTKSRSPTRPQQKRTGSGNPVVSARSRSASDVHMPVNARKPVAQMLMEIEQLEGILKERQVFYQELIEENDRLVRLLGPDAGDDDAAREQQRAPPMSEDEEIKHLIQRNARLLRELKPFTDAERKCGNDPKVLDKRNEVNLVKMQIGQVEKEIQTLQTMKKRRDGALKEIDRTEQIARKVRGQQREITGELRSELRTLVEQLRIVEKEDVEAHERHAKLQEQVKLAVSEKDLEDLKATIAKQEVEIKELAASEATWKERKDGARDENQRMLAKEQKECARLEREVDRLRAQLIQKEAELRRSYQPVGRTSAIR